MKTEEDFKKDWDKGKDATEVEGETKQRTEEMYHDGKEEEEEVEAEEKDRHWRREDGRALRDKKYSSPELLDVKSHSPGVS